VYIVDTDKLGTRDDCCPPQESEYHIPPLNTLRRAPAELLACLEGTAVEYSGAVEYPSPTEGNAGPSR
jgi:hypothetical protein